jgi:hypothetical protein
MSWKPPDLRALNHALAACGIAADHIPGVAERLTRLCLSFAQSASAGGGVEIYPDPITGTWEATPPGFDPGVAARMLQLHDGRLDPKQEWKPSSAEWRRARRLFDWTRKAHGLRVTPQQGRRLQSDTALVLYCIRVLCEATGRPQFRFSRSESNSGAPGGPMWRALIEALPLAQSFLAVLHPPYGKLFDGQIYAESIAEIIRLTRSKRFDDWCRALHLECNAEDVASQPQVYRVLIAHTRARVAGGARS